MKEFNDPKNLLGFKDMDEWDARISHEQVWYRKNDGNFTTNNSYAKKPAETVYCKICNGNKFIVGHAHCFTSIKCVNCEYEWPIHEG